MISKQNLSISQHSYVAKRSLINTRGDRKPGGCEWIEHSLSPLLTNFLVSVSGFRVGKMSAVKGMGGPGTTMGGRGPDDDRPRECINRRHQGPPDVHSSGVVQVVSTTLSENVEHQEDFGFVHIVDIVRDHGGIQERGTGHVKPLVGSVIDVVVMSRPIQRLDPFHFGLGMTRREYLWPTLPGTSRDGIWKTEER